VGGTEEEEEGSLTDYDWEELEEKALPAI